MKRDGQVQFVTQRAEQLLNQYFFPCTPNLLPEPLRDWFNHEIAQNTFNEYVLSPCLPLYMRQARRKLLLNLVPYTIREQYLLLLEEQELSSFSIDDLELLGLTKREAEVLFWIAKDKSNAGIAKVLSCSEGTIRKHLEHL
ncbi:MAG: LuxR C-terminal-related transcriptional regulator [Scytonema sp. PMC 1069.18]|nr:LuxR C-terminal-related transcriptional regulator [Scytonema sp. PMC 1069.18]MEC4881547.1 LuxR C-terminal-related transcriptional regulator [Scytonema sp. PMC 1070.18]